MTSTKTELDQELEQFRWMESIANNSISDFKSLKSNVVEQAKDQKNSDFLDIFICHLIFYII